MAINVETHVYEFSHGKKPRGKGLWAFSILRSPGVYTPFVASRAMSYGEACQEARAEAKLIGGANRIIVEA